MSTAVELLRQILAAPDDDQLRLVYADVLQAAGDPRGELVALDLELARTPRPELRARRAELLRTHGPTWWPAIPVEHLEVCRGFVERVAGTPKQLAAATAMFATEPIDRVEICQLPGRFVEAPWQANVRALAIRGVIMGDAFGALGASALGERLEHLDIGGVTMPLVPELGATLPRLRTLVLADNTLSERDVARFVTWAQLPQLAGLDIRRCGLDTARLVSIVAALSQVRDLRLSGNPIGPDGVFVLARKLAGLPALEQLEMIGTGIGADGLRALQDALPHTRVVVEPPASVTLDLVGRALVITQHAGALWGVTIDGVPQRVEIAHSVKYNTSAATITHGDSGFQVPLDQLAHALATGAMRSLEGPYVRVSRGRSNGAVYNTSVYTSEKVKLAITARAVEVTFEEDIDTSS